MPPLLRRIKFAWDYFIRGRHRAAPVELPSNLGYPAPNNSLMAFLAGMFTSHGAHAFRSADWVVVDGGKLFVRASHFHHQKSASNHVLQTDFFCMTACGQLIIESFAGIGPDEQSARMDACKSFQDSSFHALFTALLDRPCEHVDKENWNIGGTLRAVTFGWLRTRGQFPLDLWPPIFESIQPQIEALSLTPGLHWIRYFYSHMPGDSPTIEVLVDNEPSEALISAVSMLPWPSSNDFYSVRLFFIIQDAPP